MVRIHPGPPFQHVQHTQRKIRKLEKNPQTDDMAPRHRHIPITTHLVVVDRQLPHARATQRIQYTWQTMKEFFKSIECILFVVIILYATAAAIMADYYSRENKKLKAQVEILKSTLIEGHLINVTQMDMIESLLRPPLKLNGN